MHLPVLKAFATFQPRRKPRSAGQDNTHHREPVIVKPCASRSLPYLALVAAVLALSGCAALKRAVKHPTIAYESMSLRAISFDGASVDLLFAISNPNVFSIPLKKYDYTFKIGDHTVVAGEQAAALTVPAQGRGQLVVPLSVRFADVMEAIRLLRDKDEWPYSVAGSVTIDAGPLAGITIPFAHRDTLPRPMPPEISVERLNIRSLSLTSIAMDITLNVRNPGKITYTLSTLTGGLELNGRRFIEIDRLQSAVRLPANDVQRLTIPVSVSASQLARGLQSIIQAGEAHYRLVGDASVSTDAFGGLPFRLDESGDVQLFR